MKDSLVFRNFTNPVIANYGNIGAPEKIKPQDFCRTELPPLGTGRGVKVCLISTGVPDHMDIKNVVNSANMGNSEKTEDFCGHANLCAGILCANNPDGVTGLAPDIRLCTIKATDDRGRANVVSIASSIMLATVLDCHVVVVSHLLPSKSDEIETAIGKAADRNIIVIMDGVREDSHVYEGVVSTKDMDCKSKDIISTDVDNTYSKVIAEDYSSAIIGGLSALLMERALSSGKRAKTSIMVSQIMSLLKGE